MVAFRAGGIKLDGQPGLPRFGPQYSLSGRRPTDVAHADEEHAAGLSDLRHGLYLTAEALVIVQIEHLEPGGDVIPLGTGWG